ncbi:MAG: hypothetical protein OEX08_00090 [Candidatus Nomurabacteria bacterium]|nr:hypothetical protein [Candidatus Nomurabacteria bacterium]
MTPKRLNLKEKILKFLGSNESSNSDELNSHIEGLFSEIDDRSSDLKYAVTRSLKNLTKSGDIELEDEMMRLTPTGRHSLRSARLSSDESLIPLSWDGHWRMVIIDVPEDNKQLRNAIRYILKKAKFAKLKNSVWISPYPFEHMLENMKKDLELTDEFNIIVTNHADFDTEKQFRKVYWG